MIYVFLAPATLICYEYGYGYGYGCGYGYGYSYWYGFGYGYGHLCRYGAVAQGVVMVPLWRRCARDPAADGQA